MELLATSFNNKINIVFKGELELHSKYSCKFSLCICRYRRVPGDTCQGGMEDRYAAEVASCPISGESS